MTGAHSFIHHTAEMRCCICGKVVSGGDGKGARCECGDVLRRFACLVCGFEMLTGGRSFTEMLRAAAGRPS